MLVSRKNVCCGVTLKRFKVTKKTLTTQSNKICFQILLIFMQRMEMLLSKTPPIDVKTDVLPMIYRALESETTQIQELCLSIIPGFAGRNTLLNIGAYEIFLR